MKHKQMMWMSIVTLILGIFALICNTILAFYRPNVENITGEAALFVTTLNVALNVYLEHDRAKNSLENKFWEYAMHKEDDDK